MDECIIISDKFDETDIFEKYYKSVKSVKISGIVDSDFCANITDEKVYVIVEDENDFNKVQKSLEGVKDRIVSTFPEEKFYAENGEDVLVSYEFEKKESIFLIFLI